MMTLPKSTCQLHLSIACCPASVCPLSTAAQKRACRRTIRSQHASLLDWVWLSLLCCSCPCVACCSVASRHQASCAWLSTSAAADWRASVLRLQVQATFAGGLAEHLQAAGGANASVASSLQSALSQAQGMAQLLARDVAEGQRQLIRLASQHEVAGTCLPARLRRHAAAIPPARRSTCWSAALYTECCKPCAAWIAHVG